MGKLADLLNLAQARAHELGLPYAGALTPREAFDIWQLAPGAKLVDVRTRAEWDWVGRVPGAEEIEWMSYPSNQANSHFLAQLKNSVDPQSLVMFLCRSGARSNSAAVNDEKSSVAIPVAENSVSASSSFTISEKTPERTPHTSQSRKS